MVVGPTLLYSS